MKLYLDSSDEVHPIIRQNAQNIRHWFNRSGNFGEIFDGIDGKTYMAQLEPKDWSPEIWELYRKEGVTVNEPTPVEDIHYPEEP